MDEENKVMLNHALNSGFAKSFYYPVPEITPELSEEIERRSARLYSDAVAAIDRELCRVFGVAASTFRSPEEARQIINSAPQHVRDRAYDVVTEADERGATPGMIDINSGCVRRIEMWCGSPHPSYPPHPRDIVEFPWNNPRTSQWNEERCQSCKFSSNRPPQSSAEIVCALEPSRTTCADCPQYEPKTQYSPS